MYVLISFENSLFSHLEQRVINITKDCYSDDVDFDI